MKVQTPLLAAVLMMGLSAALVACGSSGGAPQGAGRVSVVASFYTLAEFAAQVGGERIAVRSLVPSGVEPHDWEPSPAHRAALSEAKVFIYHGAGFDPWADRLIRQSRKGDQITVKASEGMTQEVENSPDPHFWTDPVLAGRIVQRLRDALVEADPEGRGVYEANAAGYGQALQRLHLQFEQGLQDCRSRTFITSHTAFGPLASRYNLETIGVSGISPQAEPSPGRLAELVRLARDKKARYIFFESLVSPRVAETIAREVGAGTLELNPIEGLTSEQAAAGESYVTLMERNLANLRTALECR